MPNMTPRVYFISLTYELTIHAVSRIVVNGVVDVSSIKVITGPTLSTRISGRLVLFFSVWERIWRHGLCLASATRNPLHPSDH